MKNIVIATFKSEEDIYNTFPKKKRFEVKEIFKDYWDVFLDYADNHNLKLRDVTLNNVNKMLVCKTSALGYNLWQCPSCNHEHAQYNTCKSRFCNSCGVKYSKERTLQIMTKLINTKHRHLTFTIPDILWDYFREDRDRLNLMFEAVNTTLSSWFKEQKKGEDFKPGFIQVIHTFGRDDKWNVHIHCLIAEATAGNKTIKKIDFFPYDMLRKRFQKIILDLLTKAIGKNEFKATKNLCYTKYQKGFYVRAKKNEFKGNSKKALEYILRYCGRPCFASYRILDVDYNNDLITFWYQRHDDSLFVVERINILDFIARLIIHIPEYQFKTIRYYGFYASKSHKRFDEFKLLVDKLKVPWFKSFLKWRFLLLASFKKDPLKCPKCDTIMLFQELIL